MATKIYEAKLPIIHRVSSLANDALSDQWLIGVLDDSFAGVFS
jgi:hypothetical protein